MIRKMWNVAVVCLVALAAPAVAAISGSIQTTFPDGTMVNGNIYPSKDQVYLTGGPQNMHSAGIVPDGIYYFQVTDPSGAVLLSTDDISCRTVQVTNGKMVGAEPGPLFGNCTTGLHADSAANLANGEVPVQLIPYNNTPNAGGEYKVWISTDPTFTNGTTKTDNFKVRQPNQASITACKFIDTDGDSTYDPAGGDFLSAGWQITATGVDGGTVMQTTDQDGCTTFTYTFPKNTTTDTVTLTETQQGGFTQVAPTPVQGGPGSCTLSGTVVNAADTCSVTGGVITLTISPNDIVVAPFFGNAQGSATVGLEISKNAMGGNNFNWSISKSAGQLQMDSTTGSATFSYSVTVSHDAGTGWQVQGSISVTNPNIMGGTDGSGAIDQVVVTDMVDNGGTCNVNGTGKNSTTSFTINGGATVSIPYVCTFTTNPGSGMNTASVTWNPTFAGPGPVSNQAAYDFTSADTSVTVTDNLAGNLGTVTINADSSTSCAIAASGFTGVSGSLSCPPPGAGSSSATFSYSYTFSGDTAGTCTSHVNTANFTTNTGTMGTGSSATVRQCVGEDVTVTKTATANFTGSISKSVDKTSVQQSGGTVTFSYTVTLTSPSFSVTGAITVSNPNDWESVTVNVADNIDSGGSCVVTNGTGVTIPAGQSTMLNYTCSYTSNPTLVTGTNTATVTETGTTDTGATDPNKGNAGIVPGTPAPGTHGYTFPTLTITDNVQSSANPGGCNATLGTVTVLTTGTTVSTSPGCGVTNLATPSWGKFTYKITDSNSNPGTCTSYNNTAQITGGSSSNQVTVTVCNTGTGALTMGFWKNPNGQGIITNHCGGTSGTSLMTFLNRFNPFKDDTGTTCAKQATYVNNVISGATCSSSTNTCNSMLRAQMLATALDVYFSDPTLGGNQIGAFNNLGAKTPALGGVAIDLSKICDGSDGGLGGSCPEDARRVFGICTGTNTPVAGCTAGVVGTTVLNMLLYADFASTLNGNPVATATTGATWYTQIKALQVVAKDSFDAINNQIAPIASGGVGTPSY